MDLFFGFPDDAMVSSGGRWSVIAMWRRSRRDCEEMRTVRADFVL